jgi:RHS repeat-associated protein
MPFGEVRTEVGTISQTDFSFTGQRSISMLSIMDYIARMYDPAIGRFIQPDSIVPNPANPQSWNRYSYVLNSPVNYIDPSGHKVCQEQDENGNCVSEGTPPQPQPPLEPNALIKYIAYHKGIHLSPRDHWQYEKYVTHEIGGADVGGYTPRNPDWDPDEKYYYDKNGNPHSVDDLAVYITGSTFEMCRYDFDCIGMVMAHESGHSWIEHIVEMGTPKFPITSTDRSIEAGGEEGFVNSALLMSSQIPDILKKNELEPRVVKADEFFTFWTNQPSSATLWFFYGIDLTPSDLLELIY